MAGKFPPQFQKKSAPPQQGKPMVGMLAQRIGATKKQQTPQKKPPFFSK